MMTAQGVQSDRSSCSALAGGRATGAVTEGSACGAFPLGLLEVLWDSSLLLRMTKVFAVTE